MRKFNWIAALVVSGLIGASSAARAADEKPAEPAKATSAEKPAKKMKAVRLTKPWSGIGSLTDEQKAQIADIHKKKVADVKDLENREREAIMALLNDEQKAEVAAATEKQTVQKKMKKDSDAKPAAEAAKPAEKAG